MGCIFFGWVIQPKKDTTQRWLIHSEVWEKYMCLVYTHTAVADLRAAADLLEKLIAADPHTDYQPNAHDEQIILKAADQMVGIINWDKFAKHSHSNKTSTIVDTTIDNGLYLFWMGDTTQKRYNPTMANSLRSMGGFMKR